MTGKAVLNASRMNFQNGNKGSKNLVKEAKESQAKKEKAQERKENREAATARGNSRSGNSNQGSRGSHVGACKVAFVFIGRLKYQIVVSQAVRAFPYFYHSVGIGGR